MKSYKNILITRPEPDSSTLCEMIVNAGSVAHAVPTIAIRSITPGKTDIDACSHADIIIFVSRNAARCGIGYMNKNARTFAVGQGTASTLQESDIDNVEVPKNFNSEALLAMPELVDVQEKAIVIMAGKGGRDLLEKTLKARGAKVHKVAVYERILPEFSQAQLESVFETIIPDAIVCTSVESLENLVKCAVKFKATLLQLALVVISPRIADHAKKLGFQEILLAASASNQAIIEALNL
ncbi:MAG: uroporphyrinogen-III synthase [Gammaproteobacteria bacterium]